MTRSTGDTPLLDLAAACELAQTYERYRTTLPRRLSLFHWPLNDLFLLLAAPELARWMDAHRTNDFLLLARPVEMYETLTDSPAPKDGFPTLTTQRRSQEVAVTLRLLIGAETMDRLGFESLVLLADTFTHSPRWGVTGALHDPADRAADLIRLAPAAAEISAATATLARELVQRSKGMSSTQLDAHTRAMCLPISGLWEHLTDAPPE